MQDLRYVLNVELGPNVTLTFYLYCKLNGVFRCSSLLKVSVCKSPAPIPDISALLKAVPVLPTWWRLNFWRFRNCERHQPRSHAPAPPPPPGNSFKNRH